MPCLLHQGILSEWAPEEPKGHMLRSTRDCKGPVGGFCTSCRMGA